MYYYTNTDKPHEECGVFGIYSPEGSDVAGDIYYGLTALQHRGQAHYTSSDSEVLAYEIISERLNTGSIEEAVQASSKKIKGGYAVIVMSPRKLVAFRDPLGIKPLVLGKRDDTYILASESAAIRSVEGSLIRDIEPGEIMTITEKGLQSDRSLCGNKKAHCVFEYIYFARPDSVIDGIPVREVRFHAGKALAMADQVKADNINAKGSRSGRSSCEDKLPSLSLPLFLRN